MSENLYKVARELNILVNNFIKKTSNIPPNQAVKDFISDDKTNKPLFDKLNSALEGFTNEQVNLFVGANIEMITKAKAMLHGGLYVVKVSFAFNSVSRKVRSAMESKEISKINAKLKRIIDATFSKEMSKKATLIANKAKKPESKPFEVTHSMSITPV